MNYERREGRLQTSGFGLQEGISRGDAVGTEKGTINMDVQDEQDDLDGVNILFILYIYVD
jgi:hypothetical protein